MQVLTDGGSLDPLIVRNARLQVSRLRPGYAEADVDTPLDEVEQYACGYR